ncbi:uncharacterized protein LOC104891151 isoform X3 [Beta vulgaris subsp. vulgaris]|uniref:uncharacterized protein LOC104891151 isoform X3 n=1 Tax=Beta vulgaris subsp. vulgaris TaxID=3555 RepID=UPI002547AFDA|nr:uncharacterized protein LOC104891151 isoform X3 [Beta vulgaris subsp. vulgaris]
MTLNLHVSSKDLIFKNFVVFGDGSPQQLKAKQRVSTRNGRTNGDKAVSMSKISTHPVATQQSSQPVPDLWLEAKKMAEENSRIFAGKQIHPFFCSRKAGKKDLEIIELENIECLNKGKERNAEIGPIHVFESVKEDLDSIDWSNWTFDDGIFSKTTCIQGREISSSNDTVGSLNYDNNNGSNPPTTSLLLKDDSLAQLRGTNENSFLLSRSISPIIVDEEVEPYGPLKNFKNDFELSKAYIHGDVGYVSSHFEQQNSPQDRIMSYYRSRGNCPENSLWTNKYHPEKALEVCGNSEAVKFINDWLRLWHSTDFRFSKSSYSTDKSLMKDDSYDTYDSDSDAENAEASGLKNVLLVTGPVGSGKSAAIYACAKEQGFQVIEVNASDWRNGALLKQKFGEAVESHWIKRSKESPISKLKIKSSPVPTNEALPQDLNNDVVEVISLLEEEEYVGDVGGQKLGSGRLSCDKGDIKTLILFEDVDVTLCDDRGFISTIQQLASTGKRPMILTSNNESPLLPDNLEREEVCFTMPSLKELAHHIHLVSSAEEANIQPDLIERCVEFCGGDIRKTLLHLQFWCQSKECNKNGQMRSISPMFNLEAGHCILPKLIPWELPSLLSEFVEAEVAKFFSRMEENYSLLGVIEEEEVGNPSIQNKLDYIGETTSIEAKKEAILKGNCYMHVDNDVIPGSNACEFSNSSGSPVAFVRRNTRRKSDTMLSDSEDEICNHGNPAVAYGLSSDNNTLFPGVRSDFPVLNLASEGISNGFGEQLLHPEATDSQAARHQSAKTAHSNHINFIAAGNPCNQLIDPFVLTTEAKHQHLDFVLASCSSFGQANGSLNLLNENLPVHTGDGNMIMDMNQFPAVDDEKFLSLSNSRKQSVDEPVHFGEVNGDEIAKLGTGHAADLCLNPFRKQVQQCEGTSIPVKRCLFPQSAHADSVHGSLGTPSNQSTGQLIQCTEASMVGPHHWHLQMGTLNHDSQVADAASLNPVLDQLLCCSHANIDNSEQQLPETENSNPLCYTALGDSLNSLNDKLFHFVEAKEKEIEHEQPQAGDRNHGSCVAADGPLLQLSDQNSGIVKPEKIQQQHAQIADLSPAKCLQLDGSLKRMSEQLDDEQEKAENVQHHLPDTAIVDVMSWPAVNNCMNPLDGRIQNFFEKKAEELQCQYSDATNVNNVIDPCQSIDMSYVPESTFVPETEINDGTECLSGADVMEIVSPVATNNVHSSILGHQASEYKLCGIDLNMNAGDEEMGDTHSENDHIEASTSGCPVMDECSRMDFCKRSRIVRSSALEVISSVQKRWNELRQRGMGQYSISEHQNAFEVVDLCYRMSNLISEGDILLRDREFLINDLSGQETGLSQDTYTFDWHDLAQVAYSFAEYGYFLYAKDIDALQSKMGPANKLNLGWEMLLSTSNSMALGKLLRLNRSQFSLADMSIKQAVTKVYASLTREKKMCLQHIVQSVVPLRSYLTVRGNALHEYLSSLAHISRLEDSRLAESAAKTKRRRVRVAKNYLSSGGLDLSQDDISKLNEYDLYRSDLSKSTK